MPTFNPFLTHFQPTFLFVILARLEELHQLWELLLKKLSEKGLKLQQALVLVQYFRYLLSKTYLPNMRQSITIYWMATYALSLY